MAMLVRCVHCDKQISVADDFRGRSVRCPRCEEFVEVRRRRHRDDEDSSDEDDIDEDLQYRRRRRMRNRQPSTSGIWIGLGIGGVVLSIAAIVAIVMSLPPNDQKPKDGPPNPPEARAEPIVFPELGPSRMIQPGIQFQEATLRRGAMPMKVWYYRPQQAAGKLALVLVPPAGSTLVVGMDLSDGDRVEHFPYARAGFAVASFEIDGHVPNLERAPDAALFKGAREFRDARAGLANARAALDFILAKVPDVDPDRIYIAGHSSAATLALLVAEHEPRIKACAAYAAVTDVEVRVARAIPDLERKIPGYKEFLRFSSPKTHADKLKCPLFLFHAQDDSNVPISQTTTFADLVKKTNPDVTLVTTPRGGHYDSMIREGIPRGIAWLQKQR